MAQPWSLVVRRSFWQSHWPSQGRDRIAPNPMGPFQHKDAKLYKPPTLEGISTQFTSTQLLEEHTNRAGFKAYAKCAKEQGLGAELAPTEARQPPKSRRAEEPGSAGWVRVSQAELTSEGSKETGKDSSVSPPSEVLQESYYK